MRALTGVRCDVLPSWSDSEEMAQSSRSEVLPSELVPNFTAGDLSALCELHNECFSCKRHGHIKELVHRKTLKEFRVCALNDTCKSVVFKVMKGFALT